MSTRVAKVDAAPTVPVVDLPVLRAPRLAAVDEACLDDAAEDLVELRLADLEGIVLGLEGLPGVEVERQRLAVILMGAKWPNGCWYSKPNMRS